MKALDQTAAMPTFETADQLADWLETWYEVEESGAVTPQKWMPAHRAAAAIRAYGDGSLPTVAEQLALEQCAHADVVRSAARLANALQDLFNVAGADPAVRRAYTTVEHDVAAFKHLEHCTPPSADQPALL